MLTFALFRFLALVTIMISLSTARTTFWVGTSKNGISFSSGRLMTILRGGDVEETTRAAGIIDLRPDLPAPTPVLDYNQVGSDAVFTTSGLLGIFPSEILVPEEHEDDDYDGRYEKSMGQQSAAAETIGALCDTVYLLVAYDPNGSTVLHRTAGMKLAAVVNGMRQRQIDNNLGKTKLVLVLFLNGSDNEEEASPSSTPPPDLTGAEKFVDRIRVFFGMVVGDGAEDGDEKAVPASSTIDPFESVQTIIPKPSTSGLELGLGFFQAVLEQKNDSTSNSSNKPNNFKSQVQDLYNSMGGIGNISYFDTATSKY